MPFASAALDEIEQGIAMFAVHAIDGVTLAEQGRTDFQGSEVHRHQDCALPRLLGGLQVLKPLDMGQARQPRLGPPPAHGHFEEGDAGRGKIGFEQPLPFVRRQLGEAQFQVARSDTPAFTGKAVQAPELGMKEIGTKTRAIH